MLALSPALRENKKTEPFSAFLQTSPRQARETALFFQFYSYVLSRILIIPIVVPVISVVSVITVVSIVPVIIITIDIPLQDLSTLYLDIIFVLVSAGFKIHLPDQYTVISVFINVQVIEGSRSGRFFASAYAIFFAFVLEIL